MNTIRCSVCGSGQIREFRKTKNRSLVQCTSCGVIFVNADEAPKRDLILEVGGRFFDEYREHEALFNDYFKDKLALIEKHKNPGGHLLDVGCGIGTFLRLAADHGWNALGLDLSMPSVTYARQTGLNVQNTRIEDFAGYPEPFDIVTIFQTIEHMEDPVAVMRKARSIMKPDGILVVTTPNRQSLLGGLLGKRWFGYYNYEHLYFFDKHSLQISVENAGFKILDLRVDSGKPLTFSWVFTRVADYYYNHRPNAQRTVNAMRKFAGSFNWVKVKEPLVDLLIIAKVG